MQRALLCKVKYLISCHLRNEFNFKILRYTKFATQSSVFNMPFGSHPACSYFPAALCAFRNFPVKTRVSVCVCVFHLSAYLELSSCPTSSSHQGSTALKCEQIFGICMVTARVRKVACFYFPSVDCESQRRARREKCEEKTYVSKI